VKATVLPRQREERLRSRESLAILAPDEDWNSTLNYSGSKPTDEILAPSIGSDSTPKRCRPSLRTACSGSKLGLANPKIRGIFRILVILIVG
jgi:hypothetical protein